MLTLLPDTDPILRQVAEPVTEFGNELVTRCGQMLYFMRLHNGIGLAAPQVGKSERIIVVDFEPYVLVNPVINSVASGKQKNKEGCLSFPGLFLDIERHGPRLLNGVNTKEDVIFFGECRNEAQVCPVSTGPLHSAYGDYACARVQQLAEIMDEKPAVS